MATISGTTRAASSFTNSTWAISGGSDVTLPMPAPNNATPRSSSGTSLPPEASSASEPALNAKVHRREPSPVSASRHGPTDDRAAGNGAGSREAHGEASALFADRRHQQRVEVREQADLRVEAQSHPGSERAEGAVGPKRAPGQSARVG